MVIQMGNTVGQQRQDNLKLLETILENTHSLIAYMDRDFNFIRVNRAYAQADGRSADFFPGQNHFELYPHAENEQIFQRVVETGQPYFVFAKPFEYPDQPKRNVSYWDWSLAPIMDDDLDIVGVLLTLTNVTEKTLAEKELLKAKQELEQRVAERTMALETTNIAMRKEMQVRGEVERQLRLQTLAIESAANGIIITDQHANIIWANSAFSEMTGYPMEALLGENMRLLKSGAHASDFYKELWETVSSGRVWQGTMTNRRKDGSTYVEEQTITPVLNRAGKITHYIAIKQNIDARQQAQKALEDERQRLFSLLNELPAIVYLKDPNYRIRFANREFITQFGPPNGENCYQIIRGRDTPCEECPTRDVLAREGPQKWESRYPNGRVFQLYDYPFKDVDGADLVLQLGIDVTERVEAEEELEQSNRDLRILSQAERAQRQLAETLSAASQAFAQTLQVDRVLEILLDYIAQLIPFQKATVLLMEDEENLRLRYVSNWSSNGKEKPGIGTLFDLEDFPILKELLAEKTPLQLHDVSCLPGVGSDFDQESPVVSWIGVPMLAGGLLIGVCCLDRNQRELLTQEHMKWVDTLVQQAAVNVYNSLLFEQVRLGNERLLALSRRLVDIQEQERRSIARELHDEASQALSSLVVNLRLLEREVHKPDAILAEIAEMKGALESVMENLHRLAMNLRPASLDHLGLVAALRQHAQWIRQRFELPVEFVSVGITERLDPEIETALYRIAQEAINNILQHAKATQAGILLEQRGENIVLIIEDNGVGFEPSLLDETDRLGIFGMRERADMMGGVLVVETSPGKGTTIFVEAPYGNPGLDSR